MKTKEDRWVNILRQCPRFEHRSVPICPLDIDQGLRGQLRGEPRCTMSKKIRYRIGKDTDLPMKGLTKKEWAGRKSWDGLSDTQKHSRIARLRQVLPVSIGSSELTPESSIRSRPK
jgi:hypothetical protein